MLQNAFLYWRWNDKQKTWPTSDYTPGTDWFGRALIRHKFQIWLLALVIAALASGQGQSQQPLDRTDSQGTTTQETTPQGSLLPLAAAADESSGNSSNQAVQEELVGSQQDDEEATINMGERGAIDLQALVQWAAELEGFELMLDNDEFLKSTNKVLFFSRVKVNRKTVSWLVQEVLRANGFALVDAPVPGWKQVAALDDVPPLVPAIPAGEVNQREYEYVTAIFALQHIHPGTAKNYLSTVLPTKQANGYRELGESKLLLVTDLVRNIRKVERVLKQIDIPADVVKIEFYQVKHLEAKELADQIESVLGSQRELVGTGAAIAAEPRNAGASKAEQEMGLSNLPASSVKVSFDARTNRLVLVGTSNAVAELRKLIAELDVAIGSELRTYQFRFVSAARIDGLIKRSLAGAGDDVNRLYQSTVDSQSNQLVVTAGKATHERIEALRLQLDRPDQQTEEQSLMQFYKLKNVRAAELVATLQSLDVLNQPQGGRPELSPQTGIRARDGFPLVGPNNFSNSLREGPPPPPPGFQSDPSLDGDRSLYSNAALGPSLGEMGLGWQGPFNSGSALSNQGLSNLDLYERALYVARPAPQRLIPGEAQLTIDENTNTIIVVAEPEVQRLYAQLIQRLDVRRPQVLIEAHVVLIEGTDNLNLGVEISGGDREGAKRAFAFSSFGLSEVDAVTGALKIKPALGFNGTLVDPDTADLVIQALATHSRSRVVSSPKVVVDDNATGLLSSVAEQPFASVNATNTVATTTFAGFAQAGTTINVTPRISDDDYLNLAFDILVNSFTGPAAPNLPPPRNTDQIVSQVTIPDGYTVIVGGLDRQKISRSESGLPYIERIPVLRNLSTSRKREYSEGMLFIFLKPTILRDDQFRDMIHVSGEAQDAAFLNGDYPSSKPKLIR